MSTALLRRAPGCASDLTIDRWLLGEMPDSDAGRRFEEHLRSCAECGSRVRSLRQLYSHQRTPRSVVRAPPKVASPPAPVPGQSGGAQIIIMRDGLLVGTEVFTPGTWVVGSDPRADLRLADPSVRGRQARLVFRAGRVAVEDLGGGLCVNGFPVTKSAELRPIDEVFCGPFVLRARVIAERWEDEEEVPTLSRLRPVRPLGIAEPPEEPPTEREHPARSDEELPTEAMQVVSEILAELSDQPASAETPPRPRRHGARPAPVVVDRAPVRGERADATRNERVAGGARPVVDATEARPRPRRASQPAVVPVDSPAPRRAQVRGLQPRVPARRPAPVADAVRLDLRLMWGEACQVARTFGPGQVVAAEREDAPMPLWGFSLEESDFVVADGDGRGYRLFVPQGVSVEQRTAGGWKPLEVSTDGGRRCVALAVGAGQVRLRSGPMALIASVGRAAEPVPEQPLAALPWHLPALSAAFFAVLLAVVKLAPVEDEESFVPRKVSDRLVVLVMPEQTKRLQQRPEESARKDPAHSEAETSRHRTQQRRPVSKPLPQESPADRLVAGLKGLKMDQVKSITDALRGAGGGAQRAGRPGGTLLASLGPPSGGGGGNVLGIGAGGAGPGIGASGLRGAGQLGVGRYGHGNVAGRVTRATRDGVRGCPPSMDPKKIADVINAHITEVQRCYESALMQHDHLRGRATLEWVIGTDGRVRSARTKSSSLQSPVVESCILSALKQWRFPGAQGGDVTVSYPFVFDSATY